MKTVFITGGAGFIGSHVVRLFVKKYPNDKIINIDSLSYAGNLENIQDVQNSSNYFLEKVDIRNSERVNRLFKKYNPDSVIHLAAESHVDRSIENPLEFVETNVVGTVNLLNSARKRWKDSFEGKLFYHVSTDEVFGALGEKGLFTEKTAYSPNSPYSASKASSDHFVRAYHETYGLPIVISNCSNNYGPNQFPEKLIPLMISNIIEKKALPIYGDGKYTRDWLYVEDHAQAIDRVYQKGKYGETYCIGGWNELQNIDLVHQLCDLMDSKLSLKIGSCKELITFIKDRPGHDKRYAIDARKIEKDLNWRPKETFQSGIEKTIDWYLKNKDWLKNVTSGSYQNYYSKHYGNK
jgi:dTDP-glucose 4,6-dehydratase